MIKVVRDAIYIPNNSFPVLSLNPFALFFPLFSAALTCSSNHRWVWLENHCDSCFVWGKSCYFAVMVQCWQLVMVCEDEKVIALLLLKEMCSPPASNQWMYVLYPALTFTLEILLNMILPSNRSSKEKKRTIWCIFAVLEGGSPNFFFRAFHGVTKLQSKIVQFELTSTFLSAYRWEPQRLCSRKQPTAGCSSLSLRRNRVSLSDRTAAPCHQGGRPPAAHQPDENIRQLRL